MTIEKRKGFGTRGFPFRKFLPEGVKKMFVCLR